jgi:hypothetical protein
MNSRSSGASAKRVTCMTNLALTPLPASEFNKFLFAPIGEDSNGMSVSILSVLARSGADPWQEAENLAQLSKETAISRLAPMIQASCESAASDLDARRTAMRMLTLLPRRLNLGRSSTPATATGSVLNSQWLWFYVMFMSFMLGSQFWVANHNLPAKVGSSEVGVSIPRP